MQDIRFARTARKHRIGHAHARYVIQTAGEPVHDPAPAPDLSDTLTWVGRDDRGVELEVIAVERPDCLLVIHVMPTSFEHQEES